MTELNDVSATPLDIVAPWALLGQPDVSMWLAEAERMVARIRDLSLFYSWIDERRRKGSVFQFRSLAAQTLPKRGVYVFLDPREPNFLGAEPRIVRVGTHAVSAGSKATLRGRLRNHLGPANEIGNHRGSIFRLHVGRAMLEAGAGHGWGAAIHKAIYENVPANIGDVIAKHPYLDALRDLARKVPLVINFNFDDILADAIGDQIKASVAGNAVSVTWQPPLTDRSELTTIYHVNGILPRVSLRKRSPQLIFTEDSFADARARAPGVNAEYLFLRFIQNTMLLIGHSLADSSLKNYLRLNRDKSPANHHYMIFWIKDENDVSDSRRKDIFEANLELYNLITIFLTSAEIREFLDLLNRNDREFREELDKLGEDRRWRYHYYIVGPVASGDNPMILAGCHEILGNVLNLVDCLRGRLSSIRRVS